MNPKIAIVIPVYKKLSSFSTNERGLLVQAKKVFKNRAIFLVGPASLTTNWSTNDFDFISFGNEFFKDKFTYSRLLCSLQFYESFSDYDYIQIVQTDCWIFEDKIDQFTNLGFDYIGAPWMKNGFEGKPKCELWKVGNGGFSLRKVNSFLSVIDQIHRTNKGKIPVFRDERKGAIGNLKNRGFRNNLLHYIKKPPGEDIFWSIYIRKVFGEEEFKISDTITAAHYSFEVNPKFLFEKITMGKLPMGCHNWINNEPDFWSSYILQNEEF